MNDEVLCGNDHHYGFYRNWTVLGSQNSQPRDQVDCGKPSVIVTVARLELVQDGLYLSEVHMQWREQEKEDEGNRPVPRGGYWGLRVTPL